MAITLVASLAATPGGTGGTTSAINTTGASLLVLSIASHGTAGTPTVSDSKGNTYTALTPRATGTGRTQIFYCLSPSVGTGHTFTVVGNQPGILIYAYAGVASYAAETGATGAFVASIASGAVTPASNGALIFSCYGGWQGTTDTIAPAGFSAVVTLPWVNLTNFQASAAWQVQATAGAINPTWSFTGTQVEGGVATAVFLPAAAPTGLTRVQATGRVSGSGTSLSLTFATPPAVGNAIVVLVSCYQPGGSPTLCSDNRGNTYVKATDRFATPVQTAIHYCPAITASAAPFTVTVALTSSSGDWEAAAIEVSGVGSGLSVDQVVGLTTSTTAVSTGTTPALTASEVLLAAVMTIGANQSAITVETVSPAWTQEYENLNYSATVAGEGDTRILTGAAGTTQSCSWTASTAATSNPAVLVAFKAGAAATGIALVASSSDGLGASGGTTSAIDTTGATLLVVSVASNGGILPTVTDSKGNTYTGLTSRTTGLGDVKHRLWYCLAPTVGSGHTVAVSGSNIHPAVLVRAFSGVGSYQAESGAAAQSVASLACGSVTPSAAGALVITGSCCNQAVTESVTPSGFALTTVAYRGGIDVQGSAGWFVQATVAAINPTWGFSPAISQVAVGAAVFLPAVPTAARLSQLPVEVLRASPPPVLRLSQLPIEILRGSQPAPVLRLSQLPIEVLRSPGTAEVVAPPVRLSQLPIEILSAFVPPPSPVRLSQLPVEVLLQVPHVPVQVTQLLVETFVRVPPAPAAAGQVAAELLTKTPVHEARVTELLCEILIIPRTIVPSCPAVGFPTDDAGAGTACAIVFPTD